MYWNQEMTNQENGLFSTPFTIYQDNEIFMDYGMFLPSVQNPRILLNHSYSI